MSYVLAEEVLMLSQAYKDGFGDGWSDQSQGRDTDRVIQGHEEQRGDFYRTEYAKGYREGARAYKQRLEGRFGAARAEQARASEQDVA
jgi:hypothetical protein